ncbi:MAG: hypothetical protein CSB06_00105 [Bacteroidia bacterium]|nr:MAG: hypothetical protein CSB06_00105 [Bacteroidia bacterium]
MSVKYLGKLFVFVLTLGLLYLSSGTLNSCYAQEKTSVKGLVKNKRTGEVIPYAVVFCETENNGVSADFQGFFYLKNIEKKKSRFIISALGYKSLDTLIDLTRYTRLNFFLSEKQVALKEVTVTAEESKDLPSSSVIKQSALRHLQPNSFADVLELLPGGTAMDRDMTSMQLISIRQPQAASRLSNTGNVNNTSLGTAFVVDGVPISGDAQLQNVSGGPEHSNTGNDYIFYRNTTGKGIDMRMISTDDIEKVEIVRGIPSAGYGDLTSGLVNIKRSYAQKPLRIRAKATPSMKLVAAGKGFALGKHTVNLNWDYLHSLVDPRNNKLNYGRTTASVRYANRQNKTSVPLFFNASLDYTGSFDKEKKDKENDTKDEFYNNKYHKVRLASDLTWQQDKDFFDDLKLSLSGSYTSDRKIIQRVAVGRTSPILTATESGEYYGDFLPASYLAHLEIDGQPLFFYARIRSRFHKDIESMRNRILVGADWRYNKNLGEGECFDLTRPIFAGNGRPRRSKDIPAVQHFAFYAEDNTVVQLGTAQLNLQAGIRANTLPGVSSSFQNLYRKIYLDPRINLSFDFPKFKLFDYTVRIALHGGYGKHTKFPTLSHLYPNKEYIDIVQLNYYSQNKDLRQMYYKVKVIDPTNFSLKPNRNRKWEVGLRANVGKISWEVNFYNEKMAEGYRFLRDFDIWEYKRYDNASGPAPSTLTAPPTVDMFTYELRKEFLLLSQYTNGGKEEKYGIEYVLNLGYIELLKSSVTVNGAWMRTKYGQSLPRYAGSQTVVGGENYPYIGYYEWDNSSEYQQFNTNMRFDTKIERLGLIFSSTLQTMWFTLRRYTPNNGMPTYYLDKEGNRYPYTQADTKDPLLRFLYKKRSDNYFDDWRVPVTIDFNLKVTKRINKKINLGFYVNRILYYYPDYDRKDGFRVRRETVPYFGMELNIQL